MAHLGREADNGHHRELSSPADEVKLAIGGPWETTSNHSRARNLEVAPRSTGRAVIPFGAFLWHWWAAQICRKTGDLLALACSLNERA